MVKKVSSKYVSMLVTARALRALNLPVAGSPKPYNLYKALMNFLDPTLAVPIPVLIKLGPI